MEAAVGGQVPMRARVQGQGDCKGVQVRRRPSRLLI